MDGVSQQDSVHADTWKPPITLWKTTLDITFQRKIGLQIC